jgi:hypothetical protein
VIVDRSAAAHVADPAAAAAWMSRQRVFISSALADTTDERAAVAATIEDAGAAAVWFEEFGRDGDAEEAYTSEVDSSTIYVAILNEIYGRPNPPHGESATELEFLRARHRGLRLNVYVAANTTQRDGQLSRFIERARFGLTTESYSAAGDLAQKVTRRLRRLAAEAMSPWVKVGDLVFRASSINRGEGIISIRATVSDEIAHELAQTRAGWTRSRLRVTTRNWTAEGELAELTRTTNAGGLEELEITLPGTQPPSRNAMRMSTSGLSADDLVEAAVRELFLGEPLPPQLGPLGSMASSGINRDALREAFDLPNEIAAAIIGLVVADGLVGDGHASRITSLEIGPRNGWSRHLRIEWEEPRVYENVEPGRRVVEGAFRRP